MNYPRAPKRGELTELIECLVDEQSVDNFGKGKSLVESASIAVFDDYVTSSPGYTGKIMIVVYDGGPGLYKAFIWRDEKIVPVDQDVAVQRRK